MHFTMKQISSVLEFLFVVYIYPTVWFILAAIPTVNMFFYSLHSGFGILFAPFSFPWVLFWLYDQLIRESKNMQRSLIIAIANAAGYVLLAYFLSPIADAQLRRMEQYLGGGFLTKEPFFMYLTLPFSLPFW